VASFAPFMLRCAEGACATSNSGILISPFSRLKFLRARVHSRARIIPMACLRHRTISRHTTTVNARAEVISRGGITRAALYHRMMEEGWCLGAASRPLCRGAELFIALRARGNAASVRRCCMPRCYLSRIISCCAITLRACADMSAIRQRGMGRERHGISIILGGITSTAGATRWRSCIEQHGHEQHAGNNAGDRGAVATNTVAGIVRGERIA